MFLSAPWPAAQRLLGHRIYRFPTAPRSVSVRVRPLNKQESNEYFSWKVDGNSIVQLDPNTRDVDRTRDTKYGLDHVFGPEWTTSQIYEATTQSLIHKMVNGFNSTVFAYGQTSSGKTHTMRGGPDSPGLIPLAVAEAFRLIESNIAREYLIRVSYMEVGGARAAAAVLNMVGRQAGLWPSAGLLRALRCPSRFFIPRVLPAAVQRRGQ